MDDKPRSGEPLDSEARLRIVTDNARVGLVIVNRERRYVYANATYAEILGLPADDLVGQRVQEVLADVYDEQVAPRLERAFAGHRVAYELRRASLFGVRFYAVRYEPTVVDGSVTLVVVVITDVTEHREAQIESDRLAAIVQSSADAIIGKDLDGVITSWNSGAERIFGYAAAEMLGTSILRLIPPDRQGEEDHILGRIRHGDAIDHFETVRQTKDGRLINVDVTASPIRDAAGRVIGASKVARDISDRVRADAALREGEERMRFALQSAEVGIWDMDYPTGVLRWSESLEAQYGLKPGTFEGTFEAFVERVHPDDRASLLEVVGQAMKCGTDFIVQNRSVWPDGTVRWLSGAGRILLGDNGEPVRGVGISTDVTSRRKLEEQYHQAQKMEAVGRLAGGVAHDFNNLLTAILGYCELLLARDRSEQDRFDIAQIQKAGGRAANLTRQLLAFSRKQIIQPTLLDVTAIVSDMRPMLERLIGEDVKVLVTSHPAVAPVKADRGQIEQVVMNLVVNARDAMPQGGTLSIETANVDLDEAYAKAHLGVRPGRYVSITVTDTGVGMAPAIQARLFEPFFTTKEPGKGTGLGLATVHGMVASTGGSVGVYSEIGRGTTFTVYLPVAGAPGTAPAISAPAGVRTGSEAVLLVEDVDDLREVAQRLLERQGYRVFSAANAEEALHLFEQNPAIDVVLTDVVMPGGSGPALTRQLTDRRPGLKVIYMSGYTEEAITHHGVLKPGISFLHKPFNSATLAAKIREVLDQ